MTALASAFVFSFVVLQTAQSGSPPAAQSRQTGDAREVTLSLPHALRKGETAWLLVEVGVIGHTEVQLSTQDGQPLGAISPYAIRSGQPAGTYTIPLPSEAFHGRRLTLRLSLLQSGGTYRAPTTEEIKSVRLVVRQFGDGS